MATQVTSLNIVAGNGADVDLVVDIPSGFDQVLGRDASADISLPDPAISRRHARVRRGLDGVWLEDLGSTNGTYINGDRLTVPYRLRDGDEVRLGNSLAIFHDASSAPDATEVLAIPAPAVPGRVSLSGGPGRDAGQARRRHSASCHPGRRRGGPGPPGRRRGGPGPPGAGPRRGARTPVTLSAGTGGARSLGAASPCRQPAPAAPRAIVARLSGAADGACPTLRRPCAARTPVARPVAPDDAGAAIALRRASPCAARIRVAPCGARRPTAPRGGRPGARGSGAPTPTAPCPRPRPRPTRW